MKETISDIMTNDVISINAETPLQMVDEFFTKMKLRHLPVVKNGEIKGILSKTDILRVCLKEPYDQDSMDWDSPIISDLKASDVMNRRVVCIEPDKSIQDAAELLNEYDIHALPVTQKGKLIGIVTTTDIIRQLIQDCHEKNLQS